MMETLSEDRLPHKPIKDVAELCEKIKLYHPTAPIHIVEKAFQFSEKHHEGQMRRSGEP